MVNWSTLLFEQKLRHNGRLSPIDTKDSSPYKNCSWIPKLASSVHAAITALDHTMFSTPSFNRLLEVLPSRQSQQDILGKVISFHGLLLLVSFATAPIVYNALCLDPYNIPHRTRRHPSLGTVEVHDNISRRLLERAMALYPPDIHGINTGKYVDLPLGKTRYWLIGPESGKKACSSLDRSMHITD